MARPAKQGLDYFPLDVNFLKDLRVRKIIRACGPTSPAVLISLLSNIYREHGYFVVWDSDMPFLIADEVGISEGAVGEVVNKALQIGYFDELLFKEHSILTSTDIQKQFVRSTERRKYTLIHVEYCLIDINNTENARVNLVNVYNNRINDGTMQQRKVKKSKNESNKPSADAGASPLFDPDGIPYKSAKYLAEKILAINPSARVPKDDKGLYKWCIHIDRLLRIDNKSPEELRNVLAFAVKDPFWSMQILSTESFRSKYDQLFAKMCQITNQRDKGQPTAQKRSKYANFQPREHDWADLEKQEREYLQRSLQGNA